MKKESTILYRILERVEKSIQIHISQNSFFLSIYYCVLYEFFQKSFVIHELWAAKESFCTDCAYNFIIILSTV